MFGPDEVMSDWSRSDAALHGLAPRAIADVFAQLREAPTASQFVVTVSYVEVYNDQCNDLLGRQAKALSLREGRGGLVVDGLCVQPVASPNEAVEALAAGNAARTVAQMSMNRRSSRSHALFTITVPSTQTSTHGHVQGKLVLVDLAGMETSKTSVGVEKDYPLHGASSKPMRREEARHINTSLCALSSVIERLAALKVSAQYGAQGGRHPLRSPTDLPPRSPPTFPPTCTCTCTCTCACTCTCTCTCAYVHHRWAQTASKAMCPSATRSSPECSRRASTAPAAPPRSSRRSVPGPTTSNLPPTFHRPSTDLPWPSTGPRTDLPPTFHGLPPDLAPTFD